ncbi:MAG TPA: hypothetical protein VNJ08_05930 [Bacteriovoracaceae bacterium]|nr:hypothetical protein [Bacteriovoracaceae bacterium]
MTRFSLLFLLLFAVACGKDGSQNETSGNSAPEDSYQTITSDDPLPALAETFKINITYVNFTPDQRLKYEKAVEIVKKVIGSEEFKNKVLTHTYNDVATYVDNNGKSNSTIYQQVLNGNETLQPSRNNQMDVEVELYYAETTTVGYTYANSKRIWVNTKYFNAYTPASVAGNLFHEWVHKLGYTHATSYSVSRDYSVPYALGRMMSTMGRQYE